MEKQEFTASEKINLLVTIDQRYLMPLANMLDSYSRVHQGAATDVYVAHSALSEEDISFLQKSVGADNIQIYDVKITDKWFCDTPVLERLPEESFYRLMAFHYLPAEVTRCLYLDPDIYIQKELYTLYGMDMEGNYIAAASHLYGFHNHINIKRLNLTNQERYINSGIMLMNIEKIRADFTIEKVLDALSEHLPHLLMGDQDLINILFDGKICMIDECIYNLDERTYSHNKRKLGKCFVERQTAIIHYNGKYKPWREGYKGVLDKYYPYQCKKDPAPTGKWKEQFTAIRKIISSPKKRTDYHRKERYSGERA